MGEKMNVIQSVDDLVVYRRAYDLAVRVFKASISFPKEELYSLTDQLRRSSRSVAMNIREGFAKRKYEQTFVRHLNDALGSGEETRGWLKFAFDFQYLSEQDFKDMDDQYNQINKMLFVLMKNWNNFSE